MTSNFREVVDIFIEGGPVMVALATVGALLYITSFAAMIFVMKGNLNSRQRESWGEWIDHPDQGQGRVGEIIRYAVGGPKLSVKRVHRRFDEMFDILISSVDRRIIIITTLVAAAPMTGLLGTVFGMLEMFDGLAAGGGKQSTKPNEAAARFGQALVQGASQQPDANAHKHETNNTEARANDDCSSILNCMEIGRPWARGSLPVSSAVFRTRDCLVLTLPALLRCRLTSFHRYGTRLRVSFPAQAAQNPGQHRSDEPANHARSVDCDRFRSEREVKNRVAIEDPRVIKVNVFRMIRS